MKKTLCTFLAILLTLALGLNVFALSPTQKQLDDLKNYSILTGDSEGNLHLEDNITRAEAAKMICTLMSVKPDENTRCSFPDVAPGHWAEGWIEAAKSLGIVNGDENGNFNPFAPVTNEEYIKMLVVALGYFPLAEARGGFPVGYTIVASTYAITEGMQFEVNTPAKRSDVAIMTCRALDTPLMYQTGFGSQNEYQIMDGKNGNELITLRMQLDPEYVYETEKPNDQTDTEPDFSESVYSYEDVVITNLTKKDNEYRFNDKNRDNKRTYVMNSSVYVHISKKTLPLSEISDEMTARILCTNEDENGNVMVLGIELFE